MVEVNLKILVSLLCSLLDFHIGTIRETLFPEPAGDATHARVEIRGNITDKADIYREAIHQVHQRVKDKGDALVVSIFYFA